MPSSGPMPLIAASVARSRPETRAALTPSSAAAARNPSRPPGTARAARGSRTKGERVPSKSSATSTRDCAAKVATALRSSVPRSVIDSHPLRRVVQRPPVGPVGPLHTSSFLVAGAGGPMGPGRRGTQRIEIAGGPSLHVVVGDTLSQRLHPARPLVLRGGDGAHDGLLEALDVVRVADEGLVELMPGPGELREHQGAAEVVPAGDVLLGHEVHAITYRSHPHDVGGPELRGHLSVGIGLVEVV